MGETPAPDGRLDRHLLADGPLPAFVDWLLGAIIALGGLMAMVGGSAMAFLVDREMLAEEIQREQVTVQVFTRELENVEAADLAEAIVNWLGIGLLVVGIGMVIFAVGYIIYRYRKRRRYADAVAVPSYGTFALLGGVVASLLSFVPFATVLGGAVSGYLERVDSERTVSVGALAGILPLIPLAVLAIFALVGLAEGLLAAGEEGVVGFLAVVFVFAMLFALIVAAGLGALGGYIGGWLAEESADRPDTDRSAEP